MPLQVTPKNVALRAGETQAFQAAGAAGAVNWSIQPHSGRIDPNGVYTAPKLVVAQRQRDRASARRNPIRRSQCHAGPGLVLACTCWVSTGWLWAALPAGCSPLADGSGSAPIADRRNSCISPPLATVTASQPIRFTATAPVTWQDNLNSSGLYNTPSAPPPNPSINITATAIADSKRMASASLIWSPDIGITLQPQQSIVFGEGKVDFNAILTWLRTNRARSIFPRP
jgi:hypothetical protein